MNKKVELAVIVKPLFLINDDTHHIGDQIIQFATMAQKNRTNASYFGVLISMLIIKSHIASATSAA